jgi:lysyl-tRNA synthetase, class II
MSAPLDELKKVRLEKLEKIKQLGINPYPARLTREQTIAEALKKEGDKVSIAGRIMAIRGHGGIQFFDLRDESGKIQLVFKADKLTPSNQQLSTLLDIGYFIGFTGKL